MIRTKITKKTREIFEEQEMSQKQKKAMCSILLYV
jgi:hypothetical protein